MTTQPEIVGKHITKSSRVFLDCSHLGITLRLGYKHSMTKTFAGCRQTDIPSSSIPIPVHSASVATCLWQNPSKPNVGLQISFNSARSQVGKKQTSNTKHFLEWTRGSLYFPLQHHPYMAQIGDVQRQQGKTYGPPRGVHHVWDPLQGLLGWRPLGAEAPELLAHLPD